MTEENPGEAPAVGLRLLPWTTVDGRPCYLSTDGSGPVSALADSVEEIQLGMGEELLCHARAMLADPKATEIEFRYLARCLVAALGDALRVADCRAAAARR
ncbi:hypothetical protein ABZ840_09555 [Streptomyces sp. NPDC047117]|uniref:hypothetical protein n=1 Tax=Streptomyces sp. NPDC047117 TaxID=3155379 RepID=UPI00340D6375